MTAVLFAGLTRGAKIVTFPKFEAPVFLQALQQHKVSVAHLAPPLARGRPRTSMVGVHRGPSSLLLAYDSKQASLNPSFLSNVCLCICTVVSLEPCNRTWVSIPFLG